MFTVDKCLEFFGDNGDEVNKILIKSDQEEPIKYVVREIVEARKEGKTLVEESQKTSQSN